MPFALLLIGAFAMASAQNVPVPDVPEKIKAPAGEVVILLAHASGSQIYTCQQTADKFAWTLKAPDAELRDAQGATIGHHFAGPSWKHNDGSAITGKAVAKVDSPDPDSIPWLLVNVTGHSGGDGALSRVTSIQRVHTHGGQPPPAADCSAAKQGPETKISYTADYYFFAPAK